MLQQTKGRTRISWTATLATVVALTLTLLTGPASAVGFLTPVESLPHPEARVLRADGEVMWGEIPRYMQNWRGYTSIVLQQDNGDRQKLRASDISQLVIPLDGWSRFEMFAEATTTVEKAIKTDYEQIEQAREVVFDSVTWPGTRKRVLLQRINPGFDSRIQVYAMTNGREGVFYLGDVPLFGDELKKFIVVKDGGRAIKVKKGDYRQHFEGLFGDCEEMMAAVPRGERKIRNFADHVNAYDLICQQATVY